MEDVSFSAKMRKVARPELLRGPIQVVPVGGEGMV